MKLKLRKAIMLLAAMTLASCVFTARSEAITLTYEANESGFSLFYYFNMLKFGYVNLKDVGDTGSVNFLRFPMLGIDLSLDTELMEINPTAVPPSIKLHYAVTSTLSFIPSFENDMVLPFSAASIEYVLPSLIPIPVLPLPILQEQDIKARFCLLGNASLYDIELAWDTITGTASGTATPDSPTFNQTITIDGQPLEVSLSFDYSKPMLTSCTYSFTSEELPEPFTGTLSLPNGTYRIWIDLPKLSDIIAVQ